MELSLYNQAGNPGQGGTGPNGLGATGGNNGVLNAGNTGAGGALGDQENGNLGASQLNGMPISAASLNAMMAGAQGGQAGPASALTPSLASQFSGAAGMFPSSMITSNGMAGVSGGAASMFPGGGGAMGGMGVGVGGMNGMSLNPNTLGLGSASSIQNPAAFTMAAAGRSPLFLSNGGNAMGLNGAAALGGQFGQGGNAMMNLNGSSLLTQLSNNGDIVGANDKLLGAQEGAVPGAGPGGGPPGPGPNGLPASLLKYYNLHQNLPAVLMENEPSERPYRDHALVPDDPSLNRNGRRAATGKDKGGSNFPAKLHEILSRTDISDIISWAPHGRAWRVLKPKAFEEKIIPKYFRHCKYNSFTRQVNGWGFRRITQGPDHNAYFHELFLRGLPHLCKRMRRLTASSSSRSDLVSSIEPDFYSMSKISPLPAIGSGLNQGNLLEDKLHKEDTEIGKNNSKDVSSSEMKPNGDKPDGSHDAGVESSLQGATSAAAAAAAANGAAVTPEMLNEMQQLRGAGGAGDLGPPGDPTSTDGNNNDLSQLDSVTRHQLLQAQYLNSMNMNMNMNMNKRQDSLQQQIIAQQSLLNSLQGQYPGAGALSQLGGGMGMGMGVGSQMPSLMGGGAPMAASSFPNQGGLLGNSNQNGMHPSSNLQFY